jgi:S-(hydroxymethyl)glutathione dehydrogenase / alcohol dehydrogenase
VGLTSTVAVFGLGGVGLNVVQGARRVGAKIIVGVDRNPAKERIAREMGMTHFVNTDQCRNIVGEIKAVSVLGVTHSFECVGSPVVMRQAIEATNPFIGRCTLIGITSAGTELSTPAQGPSMGRLIGGVLMGGIKGKSDLPKLVDDYADGRTNFDDLISHRLRLGRD